MSEEELKKAIDIVAGIEVHSEAEAIAKEELMNYAEQLQQENNILAEFEKWLEEEKKQYHCMICEDKIFKPNIEYEIVKDILDKLQELKEGNK